MPWQQQLADLALEVDPRTGLLVYREIRLTVPRQSGKSTFILAKNIWRMIDAAKLGGRQNLVYVAQTRNKAREKFLEDYALELKGSPRMEGRYRVLRGSGSEAVKWENGSRWGIESTTEKAGHGPTLDVGDIDEAFSQVDDRAEQAIKPAQITRPQPQLWIVSTAGTEESTYLNGKVESGREFAEAGIDNGVCYVEYSAPEGADPAAESTWWTCMPALGHTTPVAAVRTDFETMQLAEFCRAYLNWRVPKAWGMQKIDAEKWAAILDPASSLPGGPSLFAVDCGVGSTSAAIAIAGTRADGLPHGEVIEYREGDEWVVGRLTELADSWGWHLPVLVDPASPAAALLPAMARAGLEVQEVSSREVAQACGYLESMVLAGNLRLLDQGVVTEALAGAATRKLLDAWAWNRTPSSVDICPLVAVTLAMWGHSVGPPEHDLMTGFG